MMHRRPAASWDGHWLPADRTLSFDTYLLFPLTMPRMVRHVGQLLFGVTGRCADGVNGMFDKYSVFL